MDGLVYITFPSLSSRLMMSQTCSTSACQRVAAPGASTVPDARKSRSGLWDFTLPRCRTLYDSAGLLRPRWRPYRLRRLALPGQHLAIRAAEKDGLAVAADDFVVHNALARAIHGRDVEHDVRQRVLDDGSQPAGAGLLRQGQLGRGAQGIRGEDELHLVQRQELLVLLDDGVLGLGQDADQVFLVQRVERHSHRQAAHELGDQAVLEQVIRREPVQDVFLRHPAAVVPGEGLAPEADALLVAETLVDDLVQALERSAAN